MNRGEHTEKNLLSLTYRKRFSADELATKNLVWEVLCRDFFQQFVPSRGVVLDLGAGYCEFVDHISARRRIAVDLNPDTRLHAAVGVEVIETDSRSLSAVESSSVDTVFTSNFFEHLPDKTALLESLRECHRTLKQYGLIVVMMPNIKHLPGAYWAFLDHHLPLTERSVAEALELSSFQIVRCDSRFLPYTVSDSRLPVRAGLVRAYLRIPLAWRLLGKQMLIVGRKT
jgi:SAM-dependent methyltransferase